MSRGIEADNSALSEVWRREGRSASIYRALVLFDHTKNYKYRTELGFVFMSEGGRAEKSGIERI